jgi:hypothetical protein
LKGILLDSQLQMDLVMYPILSMHPSFQQYELQVLQTDPMILMMHSTMNPMEFLMDLRNQCLDLVVNHLFH